MRLEMRGCNSKLIWKEENKINRNQNMKKLEFRRATDDTVYKFNLDGEYNGKPKWMREDKNIMVVFIDHVGWCVLDEDVNQVSWPFAEHQDLKAELPPQCQWISWKKGKSYVYELVLLD